MTNFDDITEDLCPAACSVSGCVISGRPVCGHPCKGGLQGLALQDEAARNRLAKARKIIGMDPPPLKNSKMPSTLQGDQP